MIRGQARLLEYMRNANVRFWNIKRRANEAYIHRSNQANDQVTGDQARAEIESVLALLEPGEYYIEAWTTYNDRKNWLKVNYVHANEQTPSINFPAAATVSGIEFNQYYTEKIDWVTQKMQLEQKIKELEAKVLNPEEIAGNDPLSRAVDKLSPFIEIYMQKKLGVNQAPAAVAGAQNSTEEQQRLEAGLEAWSEMEPEFLQIIEGIAAMAKNDPAMYQTARGFLLKN